MRMLWSRLERELANRLELLAAYHVINYNLSLCRSLPFYLLFYDYRNSVCLGTTTLRVLALSQHIGTVQLLFWIDLLYWDPLDGRTSLTTKDDSCRRHYSCL